MPTDEEMISFHLKRMKRHVEWVEKYLKMIAASPLGKSIGLSAAKVCQLAENHDQDKISGNLVDQYKYISWQYKCKLEKIPCNIKYTPEMDEATTAHIKHNKHHPEFWDPKYVPNVTADFASRDSTKANSVSGEKMNEISIAEMCCDWKATGNERGNSAASWAEICKRDRRYTFTDDQWKFIFEVIKIID